MIWRDTTPETQRVPPADSRFDLALTVHANGIRGGIRATCVYLHTEDPLNCLPIFHTAWFRKGCQALHPEPTRTFFLQ